MILIKSWKASRCISAMLFCLMLVGAFITSGLVTVQAGYTPPGGWPPGQPYFTLWAVVSADLNLVYIDILFAIQAELALIGIDLQIFFTPSAAFEDTWDGASIVITDYVLEMWDVPGDADGDGIWEFGVDGWDLTVGEVQLWNLNGLENLVIETPPFGYNIMPWMNPRADELYYLAMETLDPVERRIYMWEWQEVFMHDPPMIILYYPVDVVGASIPLWMNLNNPILSNRYVRQSIAHAIPYPTIFNVILPGWGVEGIPGRTLIPPPIEIPGDANGDLTVDAFDLFDLATAYGSIPGDPNWNSNCDFNGDNMVDVFDLFILMENYGRTYPILDEFNVELAPYAYNIPNAQQYLDMWRYSQVGTDYTLGPVGDADFSGFVDMADYAIWAANVGTTSADWIFPPGNDIDPDFDNDDYVNMDDFYLWQENYGMEYPFPGAL